MLINGGAIPPKTKPCRKSSRSLTVKALLCLSQFYLYSLT